MLKAIHAQESKEAAQEKAVSIAAKLREMKLLSAAKKVEDSVGETLTYMDFPTEHWSIWLRYLLVDEMNLRKNLDTTIVHIGPAPKIGML